MKDSRPPSAQAEAGAEGNALIALIASSRKPTVNMSKIDTAGVPASREPSSPETGSPVRIRLPDPGVDPRLALLATGPFQASSYPARSPNSLRDRRIGEAAPRKRIEL